MALTLLAGLLPLVAWGLAGHALLNSFFALSFEPLGSLLERVDGTLAANQTDDDDGDAGLLAQVRSARLGLAQAELLRHRLEERAPSIFGAALVFSAGLLALGAWLLGRALTQPVEQLVLGMERFGRGDLEQRLPERERGDEFDFLVRQFNRMGSELLSQRARLETTQQLAAWQDVARAMAHDLKNPLTAMKMATARLARVSQGPFRPEDDARLQESVALLGEEIDVLMRMTESFSAFARLPPPEPREVLLAPLLEEVCELYRATSPVSVECLLESPARLKLQADPDQLRRAFGNLIKNAIEASRAGGEAVRVIARSEGDIVHIEVSDGGVGIAKSLAGAELTRGLASTKPNGFGLGLPITHKIFHDHGGQLRLEPRPTQGTCAVVELPLARLMLENLS